MYVYREDSMFDHPHLPEIRIGSEEITAIVVAYNERLRFPYFLEHHRKLGVTRFFVLDNDSTDGTSEYLEAQQDVIRIPSRYPFSQFKPIWQQEIANRYCQDRWALFLDVDELFVYPGYTDLPLYRIAHRWQSEGAQAVFATMIDFYSPDGLEEVAYNEGGSFLETCTHFDAVGYRKVNAGRNVLKKYPTPPFQIYGGPRERLFEHKPHLSRFKRWVQDVYFSIHSSDRPMVGHRLARKYLRSSWPKTPPNMSKVPLILWRKGLTFSGAAHRLGQPLQLAEDRTALLHFKYLNDFSSKVDEALERRQYADKASRYEKYRHAIDRLEALTFQWSGSAKYQSYDSLARSGLVYTSAGTEQWLASTTKPPISC